MPRDREKEPMSDAELLLYWREFCKKGQEEGWDIQNYDEYQFGQFLISKSDYT